MTKPVEMNAAPTPEVPAATPAPREPRACTKCGATSPDELCVTFRDDHTPAPAVEEREPPQSAHGVKWEAETRVDSHRVHAGIYATFPGLDSRPGEYPLLIARCQDVRDAEFIVRAFAALASGPRPSGETPTPAAAAPGEERPEPGRHGDPTARLGPMFCAEPLPDGKSCDRVQGHRPPCFGDLVGLLRDRFGRPAPAAPPAAEPPTQRSKP